MVRLSDHGHTAVIAVLLGVLGGLPGGAGAWSSGDNEPRFNLNGGLIGINSSVDKPELHGVEFRGSAFSRWRLRPGLGYLSVRNGASFVYIDVQREFWRSDQWALTFSFGPGLFRESEEIELGKALEFRSGLGAEYRFYRHYRAGLTVFHLSNGGLGERNPGTELLVFSISAPLSSLH